MVIGAAGFGKPMSWTSKSPLIAGHTMSFEHALSIVAHDFFLKIVLPSWAMRISKRLCTVRTAFDEFWVCHRVCLRLARLEPLSAVLHGRCSAGRYERQSHRPNK